jgi:hypothetical protein
MVNSTGSTILQSRLSQQARPMAQQSRLLGASLLSASLLTLVPTAIAAPSRQAPAIAKAVAPTTTSQTPTQTTQISPLKNGLYLYGEAPKANQLGSAYLVFEVRNSSLQGAVYWPGSSFECLSGQIQPNRLALTFRQPDPNGANSRDIALTQTSIVASNGTIAAPVGLEGMHPIATITQNDRRILKTCQAQH